MKTKAAEFSAALSRVIPLLKVRSTAPILFCAKLEAKEGKLSCTTTNLDAHACASCACDGDLEPVCVDAASLNYVAHHAAEIVEMKVKTDSRRLVFDSKGSAHLGILPWEEFPPWPSEKSKAIGIEPFALSTAIKGVAWAPDKDNDVDLWRQCIWVRTTEKQLECCGCDGKELAYVVQPLISARAEFLLPVTQADLLVDALNTGLATLSLSDTFISTDSEKFKVAIRLAEGTYPPVADVTKQESQPLGVFQVCRVTDALQTIKALGREDEYIECRFEVFPDHVRITHHGKNFFECTLPHEGERTLSFKLDVERAVRVFNHVMPGAKASLGKSSLIFADENYTYCLGLIRGE